MKPHNPIEHVVIIVKENHTFDNYFGTFPGANGDATPAHAPDPPANDPPHDHAAWLRRASGAVQQQYHEADIPDYFALARQFSLCDNYFSEVASQSEPNHLMLIAADSPVIDNSSSLVIAVMVNEPALRSSRLCVTSTQRNPARFGNGLMLVRRFPER